MNLFIEIFGDVKVGDLEVFKLHNNGVSTRELSKQFSISRQRLSKIYQKLDNRVFIFTVIAGKECDKLCNNKE